MAEQVEKRQFPRFPIKLPVLYTRRSPAPAKQGTGWTHDLSEVGACLELTDRLEASSTLQLVFQTDQASLNLNGVVIWAAVIRQKGDGILHGVAFPEITLDQRQTLREFLRCKG
jgi:hypothetical protein